MSSTPPFRPRALGEIAIRCNDIDRMAEFYETIIGLIPLQPRGDSGIQFYKIGEGFEGHTSVLALFDYRTNSPRPGLHPQSDAGPIAGAGSSLHHIALSLPFAEQDQVIAWYEEINQPYRIEHFNWIGWRGIFTQDPEGNTVELVAFDQSLLDQASG
ncbi:VOC family protein [Algirhabdus cladophorae]|uniref:VOC family protein n=1 Tax=Algirhabdus cladophorae TaxID=3377108 RepID=UPI003B8470D2